MLFKDLFKKRLYLDCPFMRNSLHFFYDAVRVCCKNIPGPVFYSDYKGELIDWDFVFAQRKNLIYQIQTARAKDYIPSCCDNCYDLHNFLTEKKPDDIKNEVTKIYFHNHMSCNARCIYCSYDYFDRGYGYDVIDSVRVLINKKILSKDAVIYMSGGETTISNEFEDLLSLLLNYLNTKIEILTSGIKYCKSIENAFIHNKCKLIISLDAGQKDVYKQIKKVDCFDKLIQNIRDYIQASENAKENILLKYIIIDGINDTKEEIERFLTLSKELGIINVRVDFDLVKYKYSDTVKVPDYYHDLVAYFKSSAKDKNLVVNTYEQVELILKKSKENG